MKSVMVLKGRPPALWIGVILLLLVLLVGGGLRVNRLPELVTFLGDQGRDVTATWQMVETGKPALVGPGSAFGQFQRGPSYYYLLLSGLAVAGGDPAGAATVLILIDLGTIVLLFAAGRIMAGSSAGNAAGITAGIVAAALYAVAGATVSLARSFSNPSVLPFLSLMVVIAMAGWARGNETFLPIAVGALIAAWQMHDQAVLLILWAVGVALVVRPRVSLPAIAGAVFIAVLLLGPFLWHEAQSNWGNLRAMLNYVLGAAASNAQSGVGEAALVRLDDTWRIVHSFLPPEGAMHWIVVAAAVISLGVLLAAALRQRNRTLQIFGSYCVLPVLYVIWPGPVHASNLEILIPIPFLLLGYGVARAMQFDARVGIALSASVALVCTVTGLLVLRQQESATPTRASLGTAKRVVETLVTQAQGRPFVWRLDSDQEYTEAYNAPWRYLLEWNRAPLATQGEVESFVIVSPAERATGFGMTGAEMNGVRVVHLAPPRVVEDNLVKEGSFNGPEDVNAWVLRASKGGQVAWDAGKRAIHLQDDGTGELMAVQRLKVEPDSDYLIVFDAQNALPRGVQGVYVLCFDGQHHFIKTLGDPTGYLAAEGKEWQRHSFLGHTPTNCARATVWLKQDGPGMSWFRNVAMYPAQLDVVY